MLYARPGPCQDYDSSCRYRIVGVRPCVRGVYVTCPWNNLEVSKAQVKWAQANELFGVVATTWNDWGCRSRFNEFSLADEIWGSPGICDFYDFNTHWRQTGWDMPVLDYEQTGTSRQTCDSYGY